MTSSSRPAACSRRSASSASCSVIRRWRSLSLMGTTPFDSGTCSATLHGPSVDSSHAHGKRVNAGVLVFIQRELYTEPRSHDVGPTPSRHLNRERHPNMKVWIDQDLCTGDGLC